MAVINIDAYHTPHYQNPPHSFPVLAEGYEQWLGDGYYFWQDEYFAKWWGQNKKCKGNVARRYIIYKTTLVVDENDFIDTVFNEEDYYQFVQNVEKFAKACQKNLKKIPNLAEFNEFIEDYHVWDDIKVIRFQDVPENDEHVEVSGYYYKKRIQLRVNSPEIITKFAVYKNLACI